MLALASVMPFLMLVMTVLGRVMLAMDDFMTVTPVSSLKKAC